MVATRMSTSKLMVLASTSRLVPEVALILCPPLKFPSLETRNWFSMALLTKLGYPEEHTGYQLPEVAEFEWDERIGEDLRKYAHQAGLTPGQFTAFAQLIANQELTADAETANNLADQQKALRADWGDTLEDREALIRGWLQMSEAPESMVEMLNERKLPLESMNWMLSIAIAKVASWPSRRLRPTNSRCSVLPMTFLSFPSK